MAQEQTQKLILPIAPRNRVILREATDHSVLRVGLFVRHVQQLLWSANAHLTENIKPAAAQKDRQLSDSFQVETSVCY